MSSVHDLINLAEYDRMTEEATNPLFGLVRGIEQGVIDERERRRKLEETKTTYSRLMQVLNGQEDDPQSHYKIKPTFDSKTGEIGITIAERSDSDRFERAVQSGMSVSELLNTFPQFSGQIRERYDLQRSPLFNQGTQIQPQMGTPIPSAGRIRPSIDLSRPMLNNPDGSFSTEKTITVGMGDKFYNIPTIVNGQEVSPDEAIKLFSSGQNDAVGVFGSQQDAETAARDRSQQIGQFRVKDLDALGNPTGFERNEPDVNRMKFDAEQAEAAKKNKLQAQAVKSKAMDMITSVDRLLEKDNLNEFGFTGPWPKVGGTKARAWLAELNYLKGNQVLELMKDLKEASKTGATGFGNLTEKELALLEGSANRIERGLPKEYAEIELQRIRGILTKIIHGEQGSGVNNTLRGDVGGGQAQGGQAVNSDDFSYLWQ